jgi:hypothetical protein
MNHKIIGIQHHNTRRDRLDIVGMVDIRGQEFDVALVNSRTLSTFRSDFEYFETTLDEPVMESFETRRDGNRPVYLGSSICFYEREQDRIIGQIFGRNFKKDGISYVQFIYLAVHKDYAKTDVSKALRVFIANRVMKHFPDVTHFFVIPHEQARNRIFPFFKELDPEINSLESVPIGVSPGEDSDYWLNVENVKKSLPTLLQKYGISLKQV